MKTNYKKNPGSILGYLMAFAMVLFSTGLYAQCDHSFNMYDSYGDGWNGSTVDISVNGVVVSAGATGANMGGFGNSGPCGNVLFSASSGDTIDLVNWVAGSYTSEVSWDITDGDGNIIASGGHGASGASTAYCAPPPTCDNSFNMYDSYGDGWNGSTVDIAVNGVVVASGLTGANMGGFGNSGPCGNQLVTVMSGDSITLVNWTTGSYTSEVSWDITDAMGNVIASGGHGAAGVAIADCFIPSSIPGCTDSTAWNYDPTATVDDTSCLYGCAYSNVVSLPYAGTGLTNCGSGNNVTGGSYLGGEDGIYEFTAANTATILVDLVTTTTYTGLHIYDGCPSLGLGTLVTSSTSSAGNESLSFSATAGASYYVVIDTWPSPNCVPSFDLSISEAIDGCTDSLATNYNAQANNDDGSCVYPACLAVAPYSEDFSAGTLPVGICPAGWSISATSGDGWRFVGTPGYAAGSNGSAAGTYAWIDFSSTDVGVVMQVEDIDVSGLSAPAMTFAYFSDAGTYTLATANTMYVEAFDGSAWNVIGTFDQFTSGWETKLVDLAGADVAGTVSLRFRGESSGLSSDYYNDLLVDDLSVDEMPASGCTDPIATNYDPNVTIDDGSCQYIMGCTDTLGCNYDALATMDDGSCTYPGCTDSTANNYVASAGCDDGSCQYSCTAAPYAENFDAGIGTFTNNGWTLDAMGTPSGSTGPSDDITGGGNYMFYETSGSPQSPITLTSECLDISALAAPALRFHYHMYGSDMGTLDVSVNGTSVWSMSGNQGDVWTPAQIDLAAYAGVDITVVFTGTYGGGFWGDMAIDAIEVDEMVSLTIPGCTDPLALNYNAMANSDDGSCNYNCVNSSAYGAATANPIGAVTVSTCNYLSEYSTISGVGAGESYTASISGANANPGYIVVYEGGVSTNFVAQGYAPLTWTSTVAGTYYIHWMVDSVCATASGCHTTTLTGNNGILGCTDSTAINYDPSANVDDGSCIPTVLGCMDTLACNFSASANVDDGSCLTAFGCTNPIACNYDSTATCDDGSCLTVFGCTDSTASNYNPSATCDDGSCLAASVLCCNTSQYGSANAPTAGSVTISTCNYLSEVSTIYGVAANTTYAFNVSGPNANPGWITVYEGGPCGTFVAEGSAPLSWTSLGAGTYYVHWHLDNSCQTAGSCHTTTMYYGPAVYGCIDPVASNYDPAANIDDGSCAYVPGCTDSTASNYNPLATQDDGSCIYPGCASGIGANSESFETVSPWSNWTYDALTSTFPAGSGWIRDNLGTGSTGTGPLNGAASLDGDYYLYCETSGSGSGGKIANLVSGCVDLNNFVAPSFVFGYNMFGATMGTLSVDVTNDGGTTWNNEWFLGGDQGQPWNEAVVDLSAYAGQIIQVRVSYVSGSSFTGDAAIDLLRFMEEPVAGCTDSTACNYVSGATVATSCDYSCQGCTDPLATNYDSTATIDDGSCTYPCTPYINGVSAVVDNDPSCNGGADGQVSAIVGSSFGNDYYLWSNGATTSTVSGLSAGTYTVTVTDSVYGCVATASVTLTDPATLSASAIVVDAMPGQSDGSVDLTISGGTPCLTGGSLNSHNPSHTSNGSSGVHFNIINTSSSDITVDGFSQGSYSYSGANSMNVYYMPGPYNPQTTTGWTQVATNVAVTIPTGGTFAAPLYSTPFAITPVTIPAGATYGFYVGGVSTISYATATATGVAGSVVASDGNISITSGHGGTFGAGSFNPRAPHVSVSYSVSGANAYTYAWSTGDTTEDVSNLPLGPVSVTATDCNGCTVTWSGFILQNQLPGCTDPTAFNYNPLANVDDSSCIPVVTGCIDSLNIVSGLVNVNYNPLANTDDGSCTDTLLGCTDPSAPNYCANCNVDDGSCILPCASGIDSAHVESFETATVSYSQGPWTHWTLDAASSTFNNNNAWRAYNAGTPSSATGPTGAADGSWYVYCETSGQYNKTANLVSNCIDLSNFAQPSLLASYHMYGATMGVLNIDVTVDGGYTWTTLWTQSGNQGDQWLDAVVDLANYAGQIVQLRMNYTSGSSFTGDCAIDNLRVGELPAVGCTDPLAANYDSSATTDDGSCQYPGCMDPNATNYCSSCNVMDSTACTYPSCNALPFNEDWESGSTMTNDWVTFAGAEAYLGLSSATPGYPASLSGSVSLDMSGASSGGWGTTPYTEAQAYDVTKSSHFATATVCLDLANAGPAIQLSADVAMPGYYSAPYRWLRLKVDGVVIPDNSGNTAHTNAISNTTGAVGLVGATSQTLFWDLSAYAGMSSVNVTFESSCKYGPSYLTQYADWVLVDNINVQNLGSCTNYSASISVDSEPACNGDATGSATASASNDSLFLAPPYTYAWSDGQTTAQATGLVAGTYTCVVTNANGCSATASVTITEPSAVSIVGTVVDETGASDGSISLTTTGGAPCIVSLATHNPSHSSNGSSGSHFNVINTSANPITIDAISQGTYSYSGVNNMSVYVMSGPYDHTTTAGWTQVANAVPVNVPSGGSFASPLYSAPFAITPVTIAPGDTAGFYVGGSSTVSYATATISGPVGSVVASNAYLAVTSGHGGLHGSGSFSPRSPLVQLHYGTTPGLSPYVYAWSTGDSTQNISNLSAGSYSVTATDCNGCSVTSSFTVNLSSVPGCTDPLASNYCATCNVDDGSCTYPGCTDTLATNYDPTANVDDGSCAYPCSYYGNIEVDLVLTSNPLYCDGWYGMSYWITNDLGDTVATATPAGNWCSDTVSLCLPAGCYTLTSNSTWSGYGWSMNGVSGTNPGTWNNIPVGAVTCLPAVGCTDSTATNYDPAAIIDDGSCIYPAVPGCTDPLACNYDSTATVDDGSCLTVYGCTDATAFNYDPLAGCDDGSCVPIQLGCLDTNAVNYNPGANTDDGSCIYAGCTDPLASNYNASATIDDGSCSYPLTVTTTVCNSATSVRMTGPWWNWDPNGGPVAVDNGNGTWTFTFDPAPTADMEYLLVVDGVQEDLVAANTASGDWSCTPITDYWSYANRLWTVGSGNVTNTYGTCGVCVTTVSGCTDSTATNYDPTATVDDGSCQYPPVVCAEDAPTNLSATNVIQNRATINWDNMNSSVCLVDQYRIKFRPVGSSTWTQKTMGQPVGSCLWACNKVEKLILNLIPNTTYEYQMKAWYCGGGASAWTSLHTFTTAPDCPNVGNFAVTTPTTTKATFTWDDSNGTYSFMRIKARVDVTGSAWFNVGGTGVAHGTFTKDKNNLTPGESYRGQARTWCDPNGGAYKSPSWTSLIYWTMPTVRMEVGSTISNLDVYPNPSRDMFNVTFTSEDVQDLEVRVMNVVGEVVYTENLEEFVGEYTKKIDLATYTKGVYFLEITTNNGVVNKKLILQ